MTDQAEKKSTLHFGGVMVIAGTVIGGGMFALPVDLAGAWFFWGCLYPYHCPGFQCFIPGYCY